MSCRSLVYRISRHNGTVVFAMPERARQIDRINRAIRSSGTWAEFRKAMPRDEYSSIIQRFDDQGEPRPKGTDAFGPDAISGFDEGDYPPWLQREMDGILPRSFFERFATREVGFTSGSFWSIAAAKLPEILEALAQRGYDITHAYDLDFW